MHGEVLNIFCGVAVLSACYLINRMTTLVLDNKISRSILFPHDPLGD